MIRFLLFIFLLFSFSFTYGVLPDEVLEDSVLESEARAIGGLLRCVVCQNQTIDESRSDLARDLRLLVRERLLAGDSKSEILNFISERYGDVILLSPRFSLSNLFLWLSAPIIFILGLAVLFFYYRGFRR